MRFIIYWSEEDKVFIAEVPELPGCAAHGKSPDKALLNCREMLWIYGNIFNDLLSS